MLLVRLIIVWSLDNASSGVLQQEGRLSLLMIRQLRVLNFSSFHIDESSPEIPILGIVSRLDAVSRLRPKLNEERLNE